ncbi:MAG: radical SAM protein [Bdellovibrionales bacterium]|nr:radical SAM protein [Bdellovibrionales bacterium]
MSDFEMELSKESAPDFPDYVTLRHLNKDHENYVVVNWCVGNTCNYSCSYCPSGLHDGSVKWPDFSTIARFCRSVVDHHPGKKVYFEFTGGEITLWKDFSKLAEVLFLMGCRVGIISNGSRSHQFYEKLIPMIDHVCLSYHPESAKPDHFLKTVQMCAKEIRTHVNFMMHPDFFLENLDLAYKVKEIPNISIAIQPLTKEMGEELFDYTDTQRKVINSQNAFLARQIQHDKAFEYYRGAMEMHKPDGETIKMSPQRFISSGNNSWKGWHCYAGVEQIVVDMKGDIFRGWCLEGGSIGNIRDENLELPSQPVLCSKSYCHCNLDIMTTKTQGQLPVYEPAEVPVEL